MRSAQAKTGKGLLVAAVALLLASCGVQIQDSAEPLPSGAIPALVGTPLQTPSAQIEGRNGLWFATDSGLVPTKATYATPPSAGEVLAALVNGPSHTEISRGLRTIAREPLTLQPMISLVAADLPDSVPPASRTAKVAVGSSFATLPAADQLLLLGQVVLSLNSAGWKQVEFVDESGLQLAVPLPNGGALLGFARAKDFASLIASTPRQRSR